MLHNRQDSNDYRRIFLEDVPLIDLRAPIEFQQGAFPMATNLPLMNDSERQAVGTCYKQQGQQAAIALGHRLVSGTIREQRTLAWLEQITQQPSGYLYCFRGGLRSQLVQQWLRAEGVCYPRIEGGYKALRHFLLQTQAAAECLPMVVIGGNTGCGKTLLINRLHAGIDLERLAHHRGSSFGRMLHQQTSQIDFENRLAIELLKKQHGGCDHWILEDEGRIIGSNNLPLGLFNAMQQAPLVVIDDPFELRIARLQHEYIEQMHHAFTQHYGQQQGWQQYCDYLHHGLFTIRRRLGLARFEQLRGLLDVALIEQQQRGEIHSHQQWLIPLVQHYYDPMYRYQLEKKVARIVFRGTFPEVEAFLLNYQPTDH
ncbi:tRNA 2-selenouridine(34) synthase MnmH [Serratia microhaemolytica]|uniref:tRNA 2-selenouridine(34) synthase MnmH n=1 Tax=Serratia microhaemolytica TaxID=2675110 RepID=UPI000FDED3B7|nr:tRNA 2-selenouridine(34) synthase MnmH [Serratia microhaemolytica]